MGKYFYGNYFKLQSQNQTMALIPSYSKIKGGKKAYLQIISNTGSWLVEYPYDTYKKGKGFEVKIGNNVFSKKGIKLDVNQDGVTLKGEVRFGELHKPSYNIMGPFKFIPFMQCKHMVHSVRHEVSGSLMLNGELYNFKDSYGYIEGDKGRSFPSVYTWTHSLVNNGSIMLSVADIPFGLFHFTGIIGFVYTGDKTKIIGTYNFAKPLKIKDGEIIIKKGKYKLTAKLLERREFPLAAPNLGKMERTIKESAECKAYYKFECDGNILLEETTNNASFEYEYTKERERE